MDKFATVFYDGEVFRPEAPVDLEPNARYVISIEAASGPPPPGSLSELLWEIAGRVEAPPDWSSEHDHYIHGTPKREGEAGS